VKLTAHDPQSSDALYDTVLLLGHVWHFVPVHLLRHLHTQPAVPSPVTLDAPAVQSPYVALPMMHWRTHLGYLK
jgi:hypothetical protein